MNARETVRGERKGPTRGMLTCFTTLSHNAWICLLLVSPLGIRLLRAAPAPAQTNASPIVVTNAVAVPAAEIAAQSEAALANLRAIEATSASDSAEQIEQQLPSLSQEIAVRTEEDARIITHGASLDLFRKLNAAWREISEELSEWKRSLMRRAKQLQTDSAQLDQMEATWKATSESAASAHLPPELSQRIDSVLSQITIARQQLNDQLAHTLTLQNRVTEQDARVRG